MELQKELKESVDKLQVFILCPGLSGKEVTISFDKKEGVLEVMGMSQNKNISEIIELDISGTINISPKYRSDDIKLTIENGIAIVEFGLSKDVKLIKAE